MRIYTNPLSGSDAGFFVAKGGVTEPIQENSG